MWGKNKHSKILFYIPSLFDTEFSFSPLVCHILPWVTVKKRIRTNTESLKGRNFTDVISTGLMTQIQSTRISSSLKNDRTSITKTSKRQILSCISSCSFHECFYFLYTYLVAQWKWSQRSCVRQLSRLWKDVKHTAKVFCPRVAAVRHAEPQNREMVQSLHWFRWLLPPRVWEQHTVPLMWLAFSL